MKAVKVGSGAAERNPTIVCDVDQRWVSFSVFTVSNESESFMPACATHLPLTFNELHPLYLTAFLVKVLELEVGRSDNLPHINTSDQLSAILPFL